MTRIAVVAGITALFGSSSVLGQEPNRVHDLKASPSTTHIFFFDASLEPVLRIESGDVVLFSFEHNVGDARKGKDRQE